MIKIYLRKIDNLYLDKNIIDNIEILNINNKDKYIRLKDSNEIIKNNTHNNRGKLIINNNIYQIKWENKQEYYFFKDNIYYDIEQLLNNKINIQKNNDKLETNNNNHNNLINLDDDISFDDDINYNTDEKNLYKLVDGFIYSKSYLDINNIKNKKKYYCHDLKDSFIKEESLFFNLNKYNQNYIDYDNYKKYRSEFIINNENNLNKFFNINIDYDININKSKNNCNIIRMGLSCFWWWKIGYLI